MPQRDSHDHALLLLSKARADKLVLDELADDEEVAHDVIRFTPKQAIEKLLKAAATLARRLSPSGSGFCGALLSSSVIRTNIRKIT